MGAEHQPRQGAPHALPRRGEVRPAPQPGEPVSSQGRSGELLRLQRLAGNKATRSVLVQRHKLDPGRRGTGEEDEEIQRAVQRSALAPMAPTTTRTRPRRVAAFGRGRAPAHERQVWGDGRTPVQRQKVKVKGGPAPKGGLGGGGAGVKGGGKVPPAPAGTPAEAQAKKELADYTKAGVVTWHDFEPDAGDGFGKFDVEYAPAAKTFTVNMRVFFDFVDLPLPKAGPKVKTVKAIHNTYTTSFLSQVNAGWSGKFQFENVREPQSIWKDLNPISTRVNVTQVKSLADKPHYHAKVKLKTGGTAAVHGNKAKGPGTVDLFKDTPDSSKQPFTGAAGFDTNELALLKKNLPKIHFANGSSAIEARYEPDLRYVSDYLKRMNQPKFTVQVIGHANKTGGPATNVPVSQARAKNVADKLKAFGVTNHTVTHKGVGTAGASTHGSWRKVTFDVTADKKFVNVQDTTLHEFGHMLGLDDEYFDTAARAKTQLKQQRIYTRKMLGTTAYGKGQQNKYADAVTKIDKADSTSLMHSGSDLRVGHYVTIWEALYKTATTKAKAQPARAFTFKDWKVIG